MLDFSVGLWKSRGIGITLFFVKKRRFLALSLCYLLQLWEFLLNKIGFTRISPIIEEEYILKIMFHFRRDVIP